MAAKNYYLMWVGSEHYPTSEDWAAEAAAQGVSKRLPTAATAEKMSEPGTVVFVAHDDGEKAQCKTCLAEIDCPECRKIQTLVNRTQKQLDELEASDIKAGATKAKERVMARRRAKIEALEEQQSVCDDCFGTGKFRAGSGGHVVLNSGEKMQYRLYSYKRNKCEIAPSAVIENHMCAECGGFGTRPQGFVFGAFVPDQIEYITDADEETTALMASKGFSLIADIGGEPKRRCGYRKPGGVYATTTAEPTKALRKFAKKFGGCDIRGGFAMFSEKMNIDEKRFRGIKRWRPESLRMADEAAMVLEASE